MITKLQLINIIIIIINIVSGTLHEDKYTFLITFLLRMRNVSDKSRGENQNTRFRFNNFFFECVPYSNIVENIVERGMVQTKIWRLLIAFLIPKVTDTHCEYVILIAFPLQPWLYERSSTLRYFIKPHTLSNNDVTEHNISRVFGVTVCMMNGFNSFNLKKKLIFSDFNMCHRRCVCN